MAIEYALNLDDKDAHCAMCADTGWVELAGTVRQHGVTYSRGTTACKWWVEGKARYMRAISPPRDKEDRHRQWQPETDYGPQDVVMPDIDPAPFRPDAEFLREMERDFGTPRPVLRMLYPRRIWPKEWSDEPSEPVVKAMP